MEDKTKPTDKKGCEEVTDVLLGNKQGNGHVEEVSSKRSLPLKKLRNRLTEDNIFRKKIIIFLCICYSFIGLGLHAGQFGPTLLDLQSITGCSMNEASFFFNATTLGFLVSAFVVGVMFDRFDKMLQIFVPSILLTIVVGVIPWCSVYEVMVALHFLKGLLLGLIDAVGNAVIMHLFTSEAKTYMQTIHFMFAFGGIISPLISAPYLSKMENANSTLGTLLNNSMQDTLHISNISTELVPTASDFSNSSFSHGSEKASELYIAYTITALVSFTAAVPFLFLYFYAEKSLWPSKNEKKDRDNTDKIPIRLKIVALIILCLIIASYTAVEDTFVGFLATFTVKYFDWSKSQGSFATSVFWTSFAVGRFCGIFIVNLVKQVKLLWIYSITVTIAYLCLLITCLYGIDSGIWIASGVAGVGLSIFFPMFFSWTEEKFFHVDGKVTSLIFAFACIGVIINPIILARMMDSSPIWFCYMLMVESCMLLVFYGIASYIARLIQRERSSSTFDKEISIDLNIVK